IYDLIKSYILRCISLACSNDIEQSPAFLTRMHALPHVLKTRTAIQENNTTMAQPIQAFLERNFRISFRFSFLHRCCARHSDRCTIETSKETSTIRRNRHERENQGNYGRDD